MYIMHPFFVPPGALFIHRTRQWNANRHRLDLITNLSRQYTSWSGKCASACVFVLMQQCERFAMYASKAR